MKGHGELCTCPKCRPDLYPKARLGVALTADRPGQHLVLEDWCSEEVK